MSDTTPTILDHDDRGERAYPGGRQPFGYRAIIRFAEARGRRWEIRHTRRRIWPVGVPGGCEVVEHCLWIDDSRLGWVPYRGTRRVIDRQESER